MTPAAVCLPSDFGGPAERVPPVESREPVGAIASSDF
jgi:hypothetical protein